MTVPHLGIKLTMLFFCKPISLPTMLVARTMQCILFIVNLIMENRIIVHIQVACWKCSCLLCTPALQRGSWQCVPKVAGAFLWRFWIHWLTPWQTYICWCLLSVPRWAAYITERPILWFTELVQLTLWYEGVSFYVIPARDFMLFVLPLGSLNLPFFEWLRKAQATILFVIGSWTVSIYWC